MDRLNLPLSGRERLSRTNRPFTAHFSASDFILLKAAGFEPLGQVLGVSVFQTGVQWTGGGWSNSDRARAETEGISFEISTSTSAFYEARSLAISRLRAEATELKADLVLGAKITRRKLPAGPNEVSKEWEFRALGTAIRLESSRGGTDPVVSNLSPAEFLQLSSAGYRPVGIVAGNCNWLHVPSRHSSFLLAAGRWSKSGRRNQELPDVTRALYEARELAMSRLEAEASALKSVGVLGLEIEADSIEPAHVSVPAAVNSGAYAVPMAWHFFALGTAVRRQGAASPLNPQSAVSLNA